MQLPSLDSIELNGKRVIVRGDLDVELRSGDEPRRLKVIIDTVNKIFDCGANQVTIAGHRGRPEGKRVEELSTRNLIEYFSTKLNRELDFVEDVNNYYESEKPVRLLENLRFWEGEEINSQEFAHKLAEFGDYYINEAFGNSHRIHASMVALPTLLPHAIGYQLEEEIVHLSKVLNNPVRPFVLVISGLKEDKAKYVDRFKDIADKVLVGGRLPEYFGDDYSEPKVQLARLLPDKEDITMHYIEHFEGEVRRAKTIVVSGPIGRFEDEGHRQGTERVFSAVANSEAYTVAGGGDTEAALSMFGLADKIDWISTGGGAMLEYLATGTLPALEALK